MYLEYDWTFDVYRPRFGKILVDIGGNRSFSDLDEAKQVLAWHKLRLGKKTDSRTWQIIAAEVTNECW